MEFHSVSISQIKILNSDTLSVHFDVSSFKGQYRYEAGQYISIKEVIDGSEIRRSYSICTSPLENDFAIAVKKLTKGKMSTHIHSEWAVGQIKEISLPEGNFKAVIKPDIKRNHVFITAGSGITPIIAMIKTIVEEEAMSQCYLLYGSRNESNIIFKEELDQLEKKYEGQLTIKHTLSQPEVVKEKGMFSFLKKGVTNWKGEKGRINKSKIAEFIEKYIGSTKMETHYYLCGPGDMIVIAENILLEKSVDKKSIHREFFLTSIDVHNAQKGSEAQIKVILGKEIIEFHTKGDKSILDELIALKKNPPYSCTSGACSSCMAKVTAGSVAMDVCYALDDDDIAKGFVLTCQAKPSSSQVEITYEF